MKILKSKLVIALVLIGLMFSLGFFTTTPIAAKSASSTTKIIGNDPMVCAVNQGFIARALFTAFFGETQRVKIQVPTNALD